MSIRRNSFFIITITSLSLISFSCSHDEITDSGKPRCFYLSNNGNDNSDGRSVTTAWKTLKKLSKTHLHPGDTVRFEAGGIWRETLMIIHSGEKNRHIFFTRYGSGENPKILGSEKLISWVETNEKNIWRCKSGLSNPWAPNNFEAEIFFLTKDTILWGHHKPYHADHSELKQEHDWSFRNGVFFIYSPSNPDTRYESVEAPQRKYAVKHASSKTSYITFDGIDLFFTKAAGYYSGYPAVKDASHIIIRNCTIGYIGHKGSRRGYGIVGFQSDFLVERCIFSDCGRRAISFNLYRKQSEGNKRNISNIVIRDCIFKRGYHTTALDLASTGNRKEFYHGDTIQHIYFYNNYIDDRDITSDDQEYTSNQLYLNEGGAYMNDIYIFNNIFIQATARNILIHGCDTVHVWNNTIVAHNPMRFNRSVYANVSFNRTRHVDYRNNILYSNWPNNGNNNWGVLMEHTPSKYIHRDYNLYYQEYKDIKHNGFTGGLNGYFTTNQWTQYLLRNPNFDRHSPLPGKPEFKKIFQDFHLSPLSPAVNAGKALSHLFVDPLGKEISIGSFDIEYVKRHENRTSIGAYEFIENN